MGENKSGFSWIEVGPDSDVQLSQHPIVAGYDIDGSEIFVGRSYHDGQLLPAKAIPSKKTAYVSSAGVEINKPTYEILCGSTFEWANSSSGQIPDGAVVVGHDNNNEPFFVGRTHFENSLTPGRLHRSYNCMYIPFGGFEHSVSEYEVLVESSTDSMRWASLMSRQPTPDGAIVAGYDEDNTPLHVARAFHHGDIIPGKHVMKQQLVYVAYGGQEHSKQYFEILCNGNVQWVEAAHGHVPPHAVVGGYTSDGETLFIGRAHFRGSLTPGKVQPSHRTLYIPFGGSEVAIEEYEILIEEK